VFGPAAAGRSYEAAEAKDVLRPFHAEHDRRRIIGVYRSHSNIQRGNREALLLGSLSYFTGTKSLCISTNNLASRLISFACLSRRALCWAKAKSLKTEFVMAGANIAAVAQLVLWAVAT
jgi:hypothetical protein